MPTVESLGPSCLVRKQKKNHPIIAGIGAIPLTQCSQDVWAHVETRRSTRKHDIVELLSNNGSQR